MSSPLVQPSLVEKRIEQLYQALSWCQSILYAGYLVPYRSVHSQYHSLELSDTNGSFGTWRQSLLSWSWRIVELNWDGCMWWSSCKGARARLPYFVPFRVLVLVIVFCQINFPSLPRICFLFVSPLILVRRVQTESHIKEDEAVQKDHAVSKWRPVSSYCVEGRKIAVPRNW